MDSPIQTQQLDQTQSRILVVDDAPDNLALLSRLLNYKGYGVLTASNGQDALTLALTSCPDLILLDICMPSLDGYSVCRQLKADAQTREIPIIFLSALEQVEDKLKAFAAGGVDYVTKPFQLAEVLVRIETHLTIRRLRQELQVQNQRLQYEIDQRQRTEEKYRNIFENCLEGIFQLSPDGRYLSANPALARLYGYDSVEELTAAVDVRRNLYVRPGRRAEIDVYLNRYGEISTCESQIYRKDGSKIWIAETIRAVKASDGQLHYEGTVQDVTERRQAEAELRHHRLESEQLLASILPQSIAQQLKRKPDTIADSFANVTVLFADLVNFTAFSTRVPPSELVRLLNQIFSAFDQLAEQFELEKIKTIGDEYMVAGGLPKLRPNHLEAVAEMALAMQQVVQQFKSDLGEPFQLRIGIHSGPVVAGVIGKKKLTYDLWGETVNLASRLQTQGVAGQIQVSPAVYAELCQNYWLEPRGTLLVKGYGNLDTYWLRRRKPDLSRSSNKIYKS
ncbi:MAG: response regulator [Pegethrix bostrychoides GSE-TBD4-15B]|jgi:PAS domain S-box-containing protein|uniref:Adenylate cyclase n=1 Tax=Pegethrix bostrychoides GSE-TBD4-15B TaxID=2839662 RepID=A0A951PD04_9CYAN|nr:response regulator [Pegethrix bostrychoides GSE-TBD4-15B]